jgi:8-oxo-dGTP pyrophosphatase MutT (NUDIX family)
MNAVYSIIEQPPSPPLLQYAKKQTQNSENKMNNTVKSRYRVSTLRTLFTTPVMKLLASRVRCDRTKIEKDFFKLDFPRWVNIVACTSEDEIILIHQYRFGTDRVEMEIPGGAVNDGEPPLEAGLRELLEETGYAGENGRIIGKVCPNPAIQDNICYTVLVENVKKVAKPTLDDMEDIEVVTLSEDDAFALIKNGTINHGLVLNALMFYALARKRTVY